MRAHRISVRHHSGTFQRFTGLELNAGNSRLVYQNPTNTRTRSEDDAEISRERIQAPGNCACSTTRVPDTFGHLHVGDSAKDRWRSVWRRPDVLGEVIEQLRQPRVPDV